MFVVNANASQEVINSAEYITNTQNKISFGSYGSYYGSWLDRTNKYIYLIHSKTVTPWLEIQRWEYGFDGLKNPVVMTLSGFGTFTSQPELIFIQGTHDGNFFVYCKQNGGSASFTAGNIYPVTISGTTATLGAANTIPVIASYTLRNLFANGSNIFAFYSLTASPYTADTARKWNGATWSTLSGAALPTSLGNVRTNNSFANPTYTGDMSVLPIGTTTKYGYMRFGTSQEILKFNLDTETWSLSGVSYGSYATDPSGFVFGISKNILKNGDIIPAGTQVTNYEFCNDIENGLLNNGYSSGTIYFAGCAAGTNKRFRKMIASSPNTYANILFSLDGGETWSSIIYISTLITNGYNFNYTGNLICLANCYFNITIEAEIVS